MRSPLRRWRRRTIIGTARQAEDAVSTAIDTAIQAGRDQRILRVIEAGAYREIEALERGARRALRRGDLPEAETRRRQISDVAAGIRDTVLAGLKDRDPARAIAPPPFAARAKERSRA